MQTTGAPTLETKVAGDSGRANEPVRMAVLDMGSTSFHLLIADVHPDGRIDSLIREREMLQLGAVLGREGEIPSEVVERCIEVAGEMRKIATSENVSAFIPVATAALREASNGAQLQEALSLAVESPVRLLSGDEEARVIFNAAMHRLPETLQPQEGRLAFDLGGGSLELAYGCKEEIAWECSLPLGTTRLATKFLHNDPPKKSERNAIRDHVNEFLHKAGKPESSVLDIRCIGMGGTARALGQIALARKGKKNYRDVNGLFLSRDDLRDLRKTLTQSSQEERLQIAGLSRRRAQHLPAGAIVLETLVKEWELEGIEICDWGIRQGVLLEAIGISVLT